MKSENIIIDDEANIKAVVDRLKKIIECNRRKLFDYCTNAGITDLTCGGAKYGIKTKDDKINFYMLRSMRTTDAEFGILIDMASDDGEFYASFGADVSGKGIFKISEISGNKNKLSLESCSGIVSDFQILEMATISSALLAAQINPLLEKTGLNLTADGIGFIGIGEWEPV